MASGKWVNVPGKGRRFLTSEGEYRYGDPNAPLAPAASAVKNFFGGLLNAPARFSPEQMRGLTAPGLAPQAPRPNSSNLNGIQMGKYGPTDWNPSANPLAAPSAPVLPPAERAYQSAKAETAAMVATDPLMQQWSAAQQAKDYATADQLGQQIWQQKYGGTPMGQPGGAVGSFNPLMQKTFGYQAGMSPAQISQTITNPSAIPVGPGEAPYQTGDLGTRATADTGYDPAAYGITPEMIEKLKNQSLSQARK